MRSTRTPATTATAALILGVVLALTFACGGGYEETAPAAVEQTEAALPDIVQKAVTVAREVEADPENVEAVLERHGLDVESFEDMMYEISGDPQLSEAFNAAVE